MSLKSQYRLERIKQIKKLKKDNPKRDNKWIILKAQSLFGFSERLTKEYLKVVEFEE